MPINAAKYIQATYLFQLYSYKVIVYKETHDNFVPVYFVNSFALYI